MRFFTKNVFLEGEGVVFMEEEKTNEERYTGKRLKYNLMIENR
jgi:hypothetical protein